MVPEKRARVKAATAGSASSGLSTQVHADRKSPSPANALICTLCL